MDIAVLKFGGSSVADNNKLNIVAEKILRYKEQFKNVVVVVSAQGKTTNELVSEAEELSKVPDKREYDALISSGEQISASKLAILLNSEGHKAVSLTGWQAGIITSDEHSNASIETINTERIKDELAKGNIVIITGFQGIDRENNITTLGRGGSDTSAVALAAALEAKECYIFSDVEGIYTADPNKIFEAHKLSTISYDEMLELSGEGAKVLHSKCVEIGKKFNISIFAKSTFNENEGTIINNKIEEEIVKSLVKNDNLLLINIPKKTDKDTENLIKLLLENNIQSNNLVNTNSSISFTIKKEDLNLLINLLCEDYTVYYRNISRFAIIGEGIKNNSGALKTTLKTLSDYISNIYKLELSQSKIAITFNCIIDDNILRMLHEKLILEHS